MRKVALVLPEHDLLLQPADKDRAAFAGLRGDHHMHTALLCRSEAVAATTEFPSAIGLSDEHKEGCFPRLTH